MHMLKTLGSHIKEYKKVSIITPILMIGEVLMETIIPLLMASIVDDGIKKGDTTHIYVTGAIMVVMALFSLAFGVGGAKYGSMAAMGFGKNIRKAMFENIQTFSFANIDKFSTSSLITRITTDVSNIQMSYQMLLRICMRAPASLLCAMIMSFFISPQLASIYLVAVILLGAALILVASKAMKYFQASFKKYDKLNESVQENVTGIRVVKAFVRGEFEKTRFRKASRAIYDNFTKAENIIIWNNPMMQFTVYACILLISWFGAQFAVVGDLETGDLMALLTYCMNILMNLMMVAMIFVMSSMSIASGNRVCEVLDEKATITNPKEPVYEVADGSVRFENVTFRYSKSSEAPVLDNINLDIKSGETIGIIGGTGSSKSTLVNMISRLYDVDEGAVYVGGKDVREYDLETLRNQVSVVLQKNVLFSGTILENLRWGNAEATEEQCIEACKMACADEFIQGFPDKYETHIEQGGTNVSGGQKQRLCIARALLKNPKVLILDDSTSAVDTATDAKIRKAFRTAIPGTTKIIISQRISSIQDADRIIVLDDGRVDAFASHEELVENNAIYREIYEAQTGGNGDFDEGGDN